MANFSDDLKSLQEGYSKALTFWQNFVSPPSEQQSVNVDTSSVQFAPGRNLALEQYYQMKQGQIATQQQIQQQFSSVAQRPEVVQFSSEYARQAAMAARHDVNVNPAVMLPQYYGGNVYGLPQMPYLLPPQEQIYRPIDFSTGVSIGEEGVRAGTPYTALASSPLQQMYDYQRAKIGAFAGAFGELVPRTITDILGFGIGDRIAKSIIGRSVLGSIPYVGGGARFLLSGVAGMGMSYLLGLPVTMMADTIRLHNERAQAAEAISREFVTVGPELSPLGKGLRADAASRLGYSMMRITERMGMASYRDVEEILKIGGAGGLFMLDQTSGDIERKLRGVIKVFGEVAKITNDPDMRKHIQNIAEFYKFGGTPEHYLSAVEMGGIGARVTGMSFEKLMGTYGAMGMSAFQGMGLVPAYGAMYGIQARTFAQLAANVGAFSPERLATLGGIEGVSAALIRGQAVSASAFSNLVLPSIVGGGPAGIGVNVAGANNIAASANPLFAIANQPAALARYAQNSGKTMAQALQDFSLNAELLQSEVMKNNPMLGQVFLMNSANQLTRMTGGQMTAEQALMTLGVDRNTAISMVKSYGNVEALMEMKRQAQLQMAEMSMRFRDERRNALSRFGIKAQTEIIEPLGLALVDIGREIFHEGIVTPYRDEAQLQALRGTNLYGTAVAERGITGADIMSREGMLGAISRWFAKPTFSPAYEAGIEMMEGRGFLTGIKAAFAERPVLSTIIGDAISSLNPIAGFALGSTVSSFTLAYGQKEFKEEMERKAAAMSNDARIFEKASTSNVESNRIEAMDFLEAFKNNRYGSLSSYVESKYKNLSKEDRRRKEIEIAKGVQELGSSDDASVEDKALVNNYLFRVESGTIFMEELVGTRLSQLKDSYLPEVRKKIEDLTIKYEDTVGIGEFPGASLEKENVSLRGVLNAVLNSKNKAELTRKIKEMTEEYEKSGKSPEALEKFKERLDKLGLKFTIQQGGEKISSTKAISLLAPEDVPVLAKSLNIISEDISKFSEASSLVEILTRAGSLKDEEMEKLTSSKTSAKDKEELLKDLQSRAAALFEEKFSDKPNIKGKVEARAQQILEKVRNSPNMKELRIGSQKISSDELRNLSDEQAKQKIIQMEQIEMLKSKLGSKGVPSPTAATPGGSLEGQKQLIDGLDKLIEAANVMKKAAEVINISAGGRGDDNKEKTEETQKSFWSEFKERMLTPPSQPT